MTSASRMEPVPSDAKALLRQSSISGTLLPSSAAISDIVRPRASHRRIAASAGESKYGVMSKRLLCYVCGGTYVMEPAFEGIQVSNKQTTSVRTSGDLYTPAEVTDQRARNFPSGRLSSADNPSVQTLESATHPSGVGSLGHRLIPSIARNGSDISKTHTELVLLSCSC